MNKLNYIVACVHDWNIELFSRYFKGDENFYLITKKSELTKEKISEINPRYIFFPHWSWIVPRDIVDNYECVCFHMADVPYGRGGSPLQNLILRGHQNTKLTALRMSNILDAGPIYFKEDLCLDGRAEDIYKRSSELTFKMIKKLVQLTPVPTEQVGEVVDFKRRTPDQSLINDDLDNLNKLYDFIRMLDAPGYPHAFFEIGNFKFTFSHVERNESERYLNGEFKVEMRDTGGVL